MILERLRKEIAQPFLLDASREREENLPFLVAALDLANLRRDEEGGAMHHTLPGERAAPAMDEGAAQRSLVKPHGDLVGEAGEDAALNRAGFGFAGFDLETFVARDPEELLPELRGLAGGETVDRKAGAT